LLICGIASFGGYAQLYFDHTEGREELNGALGFPESVISSRQSIYSDSTDFLLENGFAARLPNNLAIGGPFLEGKDVQLKIISYKS
jgi:hypothetical protein